MTQNRSWGALFFNLEKQYANMGMFFSKMLLVLSYRILFISLRSCKVYFVSKALYMTSMGIMQYYHVTFVTIGLLWCTILPNGSIVG
jgi:hypothetical protein